MTTKIHSDRFNFTRSMMETPTYRRYEKAIDLIWNPRQLDYSKDVEDWQQLDVEKRSIVLRLTTKFLAGEQRVAKEGAPLLLGADALDRYDWAMYLSTFLLEEFKHAEFLAIWHERVAGLLEPEEVQTYYLDRGVTKDPTGRFVIRDLVHEGIPRYNRQLVDAIMQGDRSSVVRSLIRSLVAYNVVAEGILTMPSYEIVIDTLKVFGNICPALAQGFGYILRDEGRHITSATAIVAELLKENPDNEVCVHQIVDEFKGTLVGLVEYQRVNPLLDLDRYQNQKVRHYRNRCREMRVTPNQELIDQILDPSIDFVVDVTAG